MKKFLATFAIVFVVFLTFGCRQKSDTRKSIDPADRVILLIFDGLPVGAIERIPLPNLMQLKEKGCFYPAVHVPLPAHPPRVDDPASPHFYPWGCSLPNPVAMSGTVFIGSEDVKNHLIQHSFPQRLTAFTVNGGAYAEIAGGYSEYHQLQQTYDQLFEDHLSTEKAKQVIQQADPAFIRVHMQGPGSAGYTVYAGDQTPHEGHLKYADSDGNLPWHKNIWHPKSPFVIQAQYVDSLIGDFVSWLRAQKLLKNSVLFVVGDHGQNDEGWHDPYGSMSSKTPMIIMGKGIKKNKTFPYAEIIDLAPTISYCGQVQPPQFASGRILSEIFNGNPDSVAVNHWIERLNQSLVQYHTWQEEQAGSKQVPELDKLSSQFYSIDTIGTWHRHFTSLPELVRHNEKILQQQLR